VAAATQWATGVAASTERGRAPAVVVFIAVTLSGCDPVSITAMGVGAAYGVQHTLTGISYRTFTVPLPQVRSAVMTAFNHMDITLGSKETIENGERLTAHVSDREIEVELGAITPKTTRMRSTAKNGLFRDAATATEIILQTERVLGGT
jgi:hypothetical protein